MEPRPPIGQLAKGSKIHEYTARHSGMPTFNKILKRSVLCRYLYCLLENRHKPEALAAGKKNPPCLEGKHGGLSSVIKNNYLMVAMPHMAGLSQASMVAFQNIFFSLAPASLALATAASNL